MSIWHKWALWEEIVEILFLSIYKCIGPKGFCCLCACPLLNLVNISFCICYILLVTLHVPFLTPFFSLSPFLFSFFLFFSLFFLFSFSFLATTFASCCEKKDVKEINDQTRKNCKIYWLNNKSVYIKVGNPDWIIVILSENWATRSLKNSLS